MIALIKPPNFLVCFAGIIDSPFETIAGIESDVPVPGPLITPPSAIFLIFGGIIIPGFEAANFPDARIAD